MYRLLSVFIVALMGVSAATSTLSAAEIKPVIFLFGATHDTPEALSQSNLLKRYAQANKIIHAVEAMEFDKQTFHQNTFESLNTIGSEDSLLCGASAFMASFTEYTEFSSSIHYKSLSSIGLDPKELNDQIKLSSPMGSKYLRMALMDMHAPQWDALLNQLASKEDQEYIFFKKFNGWRNMFATMEFGSQLDKFTAKKAAASRLEEYIDEWYPTLETKLDFMKFFVENIFTHLEATQPDHLLGIIRHCKKLMFEPYNSHEEYFYLANARNYPIAANLEYMQPFAAERGLLLVGVYGKLHIQPLKALLEERGFEVITDDMAALEAAIAGGKRVKDEL